jgi:hypothetical protein
MSMSELFDRLDVFFALLLVTSATFPICWLVREFYGQRLTLWEVSPKKPEPGIRFWIISSVVLIFVWAATIYWLWH